MQKYQILGKKGEGTFSEVLKAQDMESQQLVAIKCMKKPFKCKEQVNRLREIQAVRRLQPHPNIVRLIEVLFDRSTGRLALVLELMDMNLYELIKGRRQYLSEDRVMCYMYQLLKGLDHAHRTGLFHRDIKPENILLNADGTLKIADFGSCKGNNELDQIHKIHNILGTPSQEVFDRLRQSSAHFDVDFPPKEGIGLEKLLPHASKEAIDLMSKLLTYDAEKRCTAKEALRHAYFKKLRDMEKMVRRSRPHTSHDHDADSSISVLKIVGMESSFKVSVPPLELNSIRSNKLPLIDIASPNKNNRCNSTLSHARDNMMHSTSNTFSNSKDN